MTSPADRTVRFSLRLAPDEMAVVEDVQDRLGGEDAASLNSVIALLLVEGYHYRVVSPGFPALPMDPDVLAYVRECADDLGLTTAQALKVLVQRGVPHQPHSGCRTYSTRWRPPEASDQIPTAPPPAPPRYATPKPAAYPPVQPVPGQQPLDTDTPGGTR